MDNSELWGVLARAMGQAASRIDHDHFLIYRQGAPPVYRERAYCYELYHQLRCALGEWFPLTVHGELDKRGPTDARKALCADYAPDLLVHRPGSMEHNFAVIEVKSSDAEESDLRDDIEKLRVFVEDAGYRHGVLLVFGDGDVPRLRLPHRSIEVWHHQCVGKPPKTL